MLSRKASKIKTAKSPHSISPAIIPDEKAFIFIELTEN